MNCVGDLFPAHDLVFIPDSRHERIAAGSCGDERRLRDYESAGDAGALLVVLFGVWARDVSGCAAEAGHWGHDDAVVEVYVT